MEWPCAQRQTGNPNLRGILSAFRSSSMLEQGVWAEVKVGGEHLRLFSGESALGVQASAYNLNAKN